MEAPLYLLAPAGVALLQALPLAAVARRGRASGALGCRLNAQHRRVALKKPTLCFGREKIVARTPDELRAHPEFVVTEHVAPFPAGRKPRTVVVAIEHFGKFERDAQFGQLEPAYQCATTYRALCHHPVERLLLSLRRPCSCLYFERRTDAAALHATINPPGIMLGLVADQRAACGGVRIPFWGHESFTYTASALLALRYGCDLHTATCYRVALARWRIEIGPDIPTRENGAPGSVREITTDINRAFETPVRRAPANGSWVHDRWRSPWRLPKARRAKLRRKQGYCRCSCANREGRATT